MSAVLAPRHSPAPPTGQLVAVCHRLSMADVPPAGAAAQWMLRRNCSLAPRQLAGVYLGLCAVSAAIGGFFFVMGAPWVGVFAGLELAALALALLVFARHAGDHEAITLLGNGLQVCQQFGSRANVQRLAISGLQVQQAGPGAPVLLCSRGRVLSLGRFVRPDQRLAFANDLRRALQAAANAET